MENYVKVLREIKELSNLDNLESAKCMQDALEKINDLVVETLGRGFTISNAATNDRAYDRLITIDSDLALMTLEEFDDSVKEGYITNDDGCGYWVKNLMECRDEVFSSEREDATHVSWYNK